MDNNLHPVNNHLQGGSSHLQEEGYFHQTLDSNLLLMKGYFQIRLKENLSPLPRICFLNRFLGHLLGSKLLDKNTNLR